MRVWLRSSPEEVDRNRPDVAETQRCACPLPAACLALFTQGRSAPDPSPGLGHGPGSGGQEGVGRWAAAQGRAQAFGWSVVRGQRVRLGSRI